MAPASNTLVISALFTFLLSLSQATNLYYRKPILNYLVRYRLGQIKAKLHGHRGHHVGHHGYGPGLFSFGQSGFGHTGFGHHGLGHHGLGHHALGHAGLAHPLDHTGYGHSGLGHITGPGPVGHISGPGPINVGHAIAGKLLGDYDGPQEEHIHHYYIEPLPYAAKPLAPPTILPNGHTAHSYFSLQSPGADIKYNHYFDIPKAAHGPHGK